MRNHDERGLCLFHLSNLRKKDAFESHLPLLYSVTPSKRHSRFRRIAPSCDQSISKESEIKQA
jgi:hypothetical protein